MRVEKFNSLPKMEKLRWLKKRLTTQPIGQCNVIFFRTKAIFLIFADTGEAVTIEAEPLCKQLEKDISEFLNNENILCLNFICDNTIEFRQKKQSAIWKASGQYN